MCPAVCEILSCVCVCVCVCVHAETTGVLSGRHGVSSSVMRKSRTDKLVLPTLMRLFPCSCLSLILPSLSLFLSFSHSSISLSPASFTSVDTSNDSSPQSYRTCCTDPFTLTMRSLCGGSTVQTTCLEGSTRLDI